MYFLLNLSVTTIHMSDFIARVDIVECEVPHVLFKGPLYKQTKCAEQNKHNNNDNSTSMKSMVGKPVYEEELLLHGQNDLVAMDIQLIRGVLMDLFAVLKFLESDDDLVYNGTICHYFIKKLHIAETKQYEWWKQNSNAVRKSNDGRRTSVSNLIK